MTKKIMELIEAYSEIYPLAKECGGEYVYQNDTAQIDALELVADIFDLYAKETLTRLLHLIDAPPAVEPKKGEWIPVFTPTGVSAFGVDEMTVEEEKCSLCGESYWVGELKNYCPNCGADMRGENDE